MNLFLPDRAELESAISSWVALLDRLEAHQEVVDNYARLQIAYYDQVARTDSLRREIHAWQAAASPYVVFTQQKYDIVRHQLRHAG